MGQEKESSGTIGSTEGIYQGEFIGMIRAAGKRTSGEEAGQQKLGKFLGKWNGETEIADSNWFHPAP